MWWMSADNESMALESMLIRIVILLALIGVVLWLMNRVYRNKTQQRSEQLQKQYARLTPSMLAALPDSEAVEAVIANCNAKLDKKYPDPYLTLPLLSHERALVYAVWLVCRELDGGEFTLFKASPSVRFWEYAAEGLRECGAPECAAVLTQAMDTEEVNTLARLYDDYRVAAEKEQPQTGLVAYLRDNAEAICDAEDAV